jgi:hypothetical protein
VQRIEPEGQVRRELRKCGVSGLGIGWIVRRSEVSELLLRLSGFRLFGRRLIVMHLHCQRRGGGNIYAGIKWLEISGLQADLNRCFGNEQQE